MVEHQHSDVLPLRHERDAHERADVRATPSVVQKIQEDLTSGIQAGSPVVNTFPATPSPGESELRYRSPVPTETDFATSRFVSRE